MRCSAKLWGSTLGLWKSPRSLNLAQLMFERRYGETDVMRFFLSLLLLILLLGGIRLHAHNSSFLPGDAFFHAVLTDELLDQIMHEQNPVFSYSRPDFLPRSFCGNAGFSRLEFQDMPVTLKKHLRRVYDEFREKIPLQLEITDEVVFKKGELGDVEMKTGRQRKREINGFSVFVVNPDFDLQKRRFGLKYNEDWADEVAAFGHDRSHAQLESFIRSPQGIADDWRDSRLVPALIAECPAATKNNMQIAVRVNRQCKILVVPHSDFQRLFDADDGGFIYEIAETGITRYTTRRNRWIRQQSTD